MPKRDFYAHPTALVDTPRVGRGTRVWAYSHVMKGARVGRGCNIGDHCFVESGASIGDRTIVKNGNMIWEGVRIDDGAFIGPHAFFTNNLYPRSGSLPEAKKRYRSKRTWLVKTRVRRGASIGAGAIILAGLEIGEFAMVGAGAVVTRSVAPFAIVIGSPARPAGWACKCGVPLRFKADKARCSDCRSRYARSRAGIRPLG